ncbi:MAG: AprI/Inh family metalloprotease inhibitor [Caulobacteraceae bacterium]|nr:AprI/Inh family metalloprotease inhibitor [Caulobacteraceae bacterium]
MKMIALGLAAGALTLCAGPVGAADNQAGAPLAPPQAAGLWTLQSGGRAICLVKLTAEKRGDAGFAASAPAGCGDALPAGVSGWTPTGDGMALTDAAGKVLVAFNRWSDSLFVSHRSSGEDIQLQRGGPNG